MTSSIVALGLFGLWSYISPGSGGAPGSAVLAASVVGLVVASFLAWKDEHRRVLASERERDEVQSLLKHERNERSELNAGWQSTLENLTRERDQLSRELAEIKASKPILHVRAAWAPVRLYPSWWTGEKDGSDWNIAKMQSTEHRDGGTRRVLQLRITVVSVKWWKNVARRIQHRNQ